MKYGSGHFLINMNEEQSITPEHIASFWERHPCGTDFIEASEWREFFERYDRYKYSVEPHILDELASVDFDGKRVLEIGIGQGAEARKIIESGGRYTGIDITAESVERLKLRCELFSLPYERIEVMNAESMSFPDESFDIVFSHGVLHHSPRIRQIADEIYRVLRKGGMVIVMLYHRRSLNYQLSIRVLRRMGIFLLPAPGVLSLISKITGEPYERLNRHRSNLRKEGLQYLALRNFIHKATDGPDNVFSSAFSEKEVLEMFYKFNDPVITKHFLNERHFPVLKNILSTSMKKKLAARYGWHIWYKGKK